MIRIAIISDIHIGKSGETKHHPGLIRQANDQALATLSKTIPLINAHKPDLLIHMGDLIRNNADPEIDKDNTRKGLEALANSEAQVIHLLGNHDCKFLKLSTVTGLYQSRFPQVQFFGLQEMQDYQIVWLDMEINADKHAMLPADRLHWLSEVLTVQTPTIIFSHYSLIPIDASGSFYFHQGPKHIHYLNYQEIIKTIKGKSVIACINAHVHLLTHQVIDGIHFISNPAFSENIAGNDYPENNPGIYSILEIDRDTLTFSSFSQQFAFAKIQSELKL